MRACRLWPATHWAAYFGCVASSSVGSSRVRQLRNAIGCSMRFAPTAGASRRDLDAVLAQMLRGPDAGEHQQLRRAVGAGAHDHLALGAALSTFTAALVLDTDGAIAVEHDPVSHVRSVTTVRFERVGAGWR